ncbi:hypothetical protein HK639_72 [Escherichia phage HK639]|nr:hypothetical protein HK639_72 [Escherichia phage HK639]ADO67755.1 unknown [Escherichia phage HK639]
MAGELSETNREKNMSEAKPQDGTTVKGYRTLSPGDIERMNRLKGVSRHFCNLHDTEREHVNDELSATGNHSAEANEAARCLAIARTKMQEACMWACRAVARPDADC